MLKVLPLGECQQPLILPQVSYLTTLNNVYRSETDNKGTPNTESASGLGAGLRGGFSTTLTENMLHHHYVDRQHRQPWVQKRAGT